jgi:hypothetical protein
MSRPRKYPDELRERAVRLVFESKRPIAHVAQDLGRAQGVAASPGAAGGGGQRSLGWVSARADAW